MAEWPLGQCDSHATGREAPTEARAQTLNPGILCQNLAQGCAQALRPLRVTSAPRRETGVASRSLLASSSYAASAVNYYWCDETREYLSTGHLARSPEPSAGVCICLCASRRTHQPATCTGTSTSVLVEPLLGRKGGDHILRWHEIGYFNCNSCTECLISSPSYRQDTVVATWWLRAPPQAEAAPTPPDVLATRWMGCCSSAAGMLGCIVPWFLGSRSTTSEARPSLGRRQNA